MFSEKGLKKKTQSNTKKAMMDKARVQVEAENARKKERTVQPSQAKKGSDSPGMVSKLVGSFWSGGGDANPQQAFEKRQKEGEVALIKVKQYLNTFPELQKSGIKVPPASASPEDKIHALAHIHTILGSEGAVDQIHDTLFFVVNGLLSYIDSNADLAQRFPLSGPKFNLVQAIASHEFKQQIDKECKELAIEYAEWLSASALKRFGRKIMYLTWNIRQGNLEALASGEGRQSAKYDEL